MIDSDAASATDLSDECYMETLCRRNLSEGIHCWIRDSPLIHESLDVIGILVSINVNTIDKLFAFERTYVFEPDC